MRFTRDKSILKSIAQTLTGAFCGFSRKWWLPNQQLVDFLPRYLPKTHSTFPGKYWNSRMWCMGHPWTFELSPNWTNVLSAAPKSLSVKVCMSKQSRSPQYRQRVSKRGYLQGGSRIIKKDRHRHVSRLYHVSIQQFLNTKEKHSQTFVPIALNKRDDEGAELIKALKVNFWARTTSRSYKLLKKALYIRHFATEASKKQAGGTYLNLFCSASPFQIRW